LIVLEIFLKNLKNQIFLYEVKLIIVGQGRVGKTCIATALVDDNYVLHETKSTEGININRWIIPKEDIVKINPKIQRDFQINIWDFGGQEIYHSTHQFFLTKRSIYMLVTESRKEDSHDDFYYWLNIIKLLGDESPVFVVMNKCDQPTKDIPIKEYRESFTNIIGFEKISLQAEYKDKLNTFKSLIKEISSKLSHIGNPLPKKWVDIRIEIEQLKLSGKNYITENEYFEICRKHYRNQEGALFLSDYFHDLGVILHFQDDLDLKDTVILNNEWITTGVYKILDDKSVIERNGRFNKSDLSRILSGEEYRYKIRELLSLMKNKKFDLCFELDNGEYLVPRLLPVDEIEHDWDSSPSNLRFEYRYKFMPKGILARLIVKMNSDIWSNLYWRYGVLLKYENTYAKVKEKYFENKITIEIYGENKRKYLFLIRKAIDSIHKDFNRITYSEMIPCICGECSSTNKPHFYSYNTLKKYELHQRTKITCEHSMEEVLVTTMTSNISNQNFSDEIIVFCENQNEKLFTSLGINNVFFFSERDSAGVYIKVKTNTDKNWGIRDRDYLLDTEIAKLRKKYPKFLVLEYYAVENYLLHPENIEELNPKDFKKSDYINEIRNQKNDKKHHIFSIYKNSRKSYQEFKVESDKFFDKTNEEIIMQNLESDDFETFYKHFSMKDHFNKQNNIGKYNFKSNELAGTKWFKNKIQNLIEQSVHQ
jgi:internalin A